MSDPVAETLDHAALLRPFLAARFRSRYANVLPGSARRTELLNKLCHRYEEVLAWKYARPTHGGGSARELRAFGAAATCYCLCVPEEFDGREVPLDEALAALRGSGSAVLLVCRRGAVAYFEPEYESGAARQYVLLRPSS